MILYYNKNIFNEIDGSSGFSDLISRIICPYYRNFYIIADSIFLSALMSMSN